MKFEGDTPVIDRISSGLWSLDRALRDDMEIGLPLRSIYEIYGTWGYGKSTLAYYLAGKTAQALNKSKVVVCDLEGNMDKDYAMSAFSQSGWEGTIQGINYGEGKKGKRVPRPHEAMLQEAIDAIREPEVGAVVVDSLAAFIPVAGLEGDIGDALWGQRAKRLADASRRATAWLRIEEDPKAVFLVNHVHQEMGGRGHSTPGGVTPKYLANVRLVIYRQETFDSGAFIAKVQPEKLKYGGTNKDRKAFVAFLPGVGVSRELTALFDCVNLGLASRENTVKMNVRKRNGSEKEVSFGYISQLIEDAKDPEKRDKFQPFYDALAAYNEDEDDD